MYHYTVGEPSRRTTTHLAAWVCNLFGATTAHHSKAWHYALLRQPSGLMGAGVTLHCYCCLWLHGVCLEDYLDKLQAVRLFKRDGIRPHVML